MARGRILAASVSVLVSAAVGVVTNVVTSNWNVVLLTVLGALVVLGVVLQVVVSRSEEPGRTGGLTARASRGGQVVQAGRDVILPGRTVRAEHDVILPGRQPTPPLPRPEEHDGDR
ncbi:hypothetical protein [Actinoplanes sp. GCM10030250]|uniref:hypothetical protein n=1 Tax=Actinoplanes sp. GCM10030250 TaxID=3273376 RepID=UPI00360D282D